MNALTISFRYASNSPLHFFQRLLGLVFGISSLYVVFSFFLFESSYDKFLKDYERTYRVSTFIKKDQLELNWVITSSSLIPILKSIPEVEDATKMLPTFTNWTFYFNNFHLFPKGSGLIVDNNFLSVLDFPLSRGNKETCLAQNGSIVISQEFAMRVFGELDVIGKQLDASFTESKVPLVVTGLLRPIPENSSLRFDFLVPGPTFSSWTGGDTPAAFSYYVFFRATKGASPDLIKEKIGKESRRLYNERVSFPIVQIGDIHFKSTGLFEYAPRGDMNFVVVLLVASGMLVLTMLFNFSLLNSLDRFYRFKELFIKALYGQRSAALFLQFLLETAALWFLASLISILVADYVIQHHVNSWFKIHLTLFNDTFDTKEIIIGCILFSVLFGASTNLHFLFKLGNRKHPNSSRILLAFQILFSITIMAVSRIASKQIEFLTGRDIGFERRGVVSVSRPIDMSYSEWRRFKDILRVEPMVSSFSSSYHELIGNYDSTMAYLLDESHSSADQVSHRVHWNVVDENFVKTLGIRLIRGRDFSDSESDSINILINESALNEFGLKEVSNVEVGNGVLGRARIVGVIADYHFQPFSNKILPMIFFMSHKESYDRNLLIKLNGDANLAILSVKRDWEKTGVKSEPNFSFVEDSVDSFTSKEVGVTNLISSSSSMISMLSLFGLLGLLLYELESRKKELCIRAVLGATRMKLAITLFGRYLIYILVGFLISIPISFWIGTTWLQNFAYKIQVNAMDYLLLFVSIGMFCCFIFAFKTWNVGRMNLAKELKE